MPVIGEAGRLHATTRAIPISSQGADLIKCTVLQLWYYARAADSEDHWHQTDRPGRGRAFATRGYTGMGD